MVLVVYILSIIHFTILHRCDYTNVCWISGNFLSLALSPLIPLFFCDDDNEFLPFLPPLQLCTFIYVAFSSFLRDIHNKNYNQPLFYLKMSGTHSKWINLHSNAPEKQRRSECWMNGKINKTTQEMMLEMVFFSHSALRPCNFFALDSPDVWELFPHSSLGTRSLTLYRLRVCFSQSIKEKFHKQISIHFLPLLILECDYVRRKI